MSKVIKSKIVQETIRTIPSGKIFSCKDVSNAIPTDYRITTAKISYELRHLIGIDIEIAYQFTKAEKMRILYRRL